jgi:amino acid permease
MMHWAKIVGVAIMLAFLSLPLLYYVAAVFNLEWLADFIDAAAQDRTKRTLFYILLTSGLLGLVWIAEKIEKREKN